MNDYQKKILQYLVERGSIEVNTLSELLQLSPSTIRRQLAVMQKKGLLVRTHGGATLPHPIHYGAHFESRATHEMEAKRKIAAAAKKLLYPGLAIGISGGTTCTEFARQFCAAGSLTIVTNALNIALELQGLPDSRIVITGGILNKGSYELVGDQVSGGLENISLEIAFLGCSGVDLSFGFSMFDEPEAVAGRAFISAAVRTIVLADHTKLGKANFARLCPIQEVDLLIVDDGVTPQQLRSLESSGLKVMVASSPEGSCT